MANRGLYLSKKGRKSLERKMGEIEEHETEEKGDHKWKSPLKWAPHSCTMAGKSNRKPPRTSLFQKLQELPRHVLKPLTGEGKMGKEITQMWSENYTSQSIDKLQICSRLINIRSKWIYVYLYFVILSYNFSLKKKLGFIKILNKK